MLRLFTVFSARTNCLQFFWSLAMCSEVRCVQVCASKMVRASRTPWRSCEVDQRHFLRRSRIRSSVWQLVPKTSRHATLRPPAHRKETDGGHEESVTASWASGCELLVCSQSRVWAAANPLVSLRLDFSPARGKFHFDVQPTLDVTAMTEPSRSASARSHRRSQISQDSPRQCSAVCFAVLLVEAQRLRGRRPRETVAVCHESDSIAQRSLLLSLSFGALFADAVRLVECPDGDR